jgi:hypothetical protein
MASNSAGLPEAAGKAGTDYRGGVCLIGGRSLSAGVRVVVAVPGHCVRQRHRHGGGQLAVAYLYG